MLLICHKNRKVYDYLKLKRYDKTGPVNFYLQRSMEEMRCQVENLQRELEQAKSQNRMIQTRLDETEKEGTELSAECDELAKQLNAEKDNVSIELKGSIWYI